MYSALALGDGVPDELVRWQLAETFGWPLEYIDGLSVADLNQYISVLDGKAHAHTSIIKR